MTGESMTIQDYCKEHRCWAAKDKNGDWFIFFARPTFNTANSDWVSSESIGGCDAVSHDVITPDVQWEKSLIAPDGRLILMEPLKPKQASKQLQIGEWYKIELVGNYFQKMFSLDFTKPHKCNDIFPSTGILQMALFDDRWAILVDMIKSFTKVTPPKAYTPKKYDTVFAWNDAFDERTPPAIETYWGDAKFVTRPKVHVVFPNGRYMELKGKSKNEEYNFMTSNGWLYDYILPFDVSLIGVPIKDLPKEA